MCRKTGKCSETTKEHDYCRKAEVLNVKQEQLSPMRLRALAADTIVILVFDTDKGDLVQLKKNLEILRRNSHIKQVWCAIQVENLEDELKRSTDVKEIKDLTDSKNNKNFKHDFIVEKNLYEKLKRHNFDYSKLWVTDPPTEYSGISNDGSKVKK